MKKYIINLMMLFLGFVFGGTVSGKILDKEIKKENDLSEKHLSLFLMMNQWVKVKQERKELADYFSKEGYEKIAIYGMSYAGETLLSELRDTEIKVAYAIDRNAGSIYGDLDIVPIEDIHDEVDAVIVTAITFFDEIKEKLMDKVSCPIISLEDVLYEI